VTCPTLQYLPTLSHEWYDFQKGGKKEEDERIRRRRRKELYIKCVF
jgi:hypothetical protein